MLWRTDVFIFLSSLPISSSLLSAVPRRRSLSTERTLSKISCLLSGLHLSSFAVRFTKESMSETDMSLDMVSWESLDSPPPISRRMSLAVWKYASSRVSSPCTVLSSVMITDMYPFTSAGVMSLAYALYMPSTPRRMEPFVSLVICFM